MFTDIAQVCSEMQIGWLQEEGVARPQKSQVNNIDFEDYNTECNITDMICQNLYSVWTVQVY